MEEKDFLCIEGVVEHIVFLSEETGFAVIEIATDNELITAVGEMPNVVEGEEVKLTGKYVTHQNFGLQFKVELYEVKLPSTANAIYKYLSSGVIRGVGEKTAKKIVDCFGDQTLVILENNPERLVEVESISKSKAASITSEYVKHFGMKNTVSFLNSIGLSPMQSIKVFKKYGVNSKEMVKTNPYLICDDEIGVGFEIADQIAASFELEKDSEFRIYAGIYFVLNHNLKNGHACLPLQKLKETSAEFLELSIETLEENLNIFIREEKFVTLLGEKTTFIYIPFVYKAEAYIATRLSMSIEYNTADPSVASQEQLDLIEQELDLNFEKLQRTAIIQSVINPVMILTGGPGTGKTTTLNGIIKYFEILGLQVEVCAPTGRAAKRASDVTGYNAKTIHRLLEVEFSSNIENRSFKHNEKNPIDADVIVVDEVSMVDVLLFEKLLRGISLSTKIVLVGDYEQLPPVGAGNILKDLIKSGVVPTVELREIFRQAAKSLIVTNSHKIVKGELPKLGVKDNDFFFLQTNENELTAQTVVELCTQRLPAAYNYNPLWDIQVLTPSRVGDLGCVELNRRLQEKLNPKAKNKKQITFPNGVFREGDKVMQTKNNYDLIWEKENGEEGSGIFNGDVGVITMVEKSLDVIRIEFDDKICHYTVDMLGEIELAYAVTVHKSQGSEFDCVVIPLSMRTNRLYYRNLLYTAVTRAKKNLIIVGNVPALKQMINNNVKMLRYSNLSRLLIESIEKNNSM